MMKAKKFKSNLPLNLKYITTFFVFIVAIFASTNISSVKAAEEEQKYVCPRPKKIFEVGIKEAFNFNAKKCVYKTVVESAEDVDIGRTIKNIFTAGTTDVPIWLITGKSQPQLQGCTVREMVEKGIMLQSYDDIDDEEIRELAKNPEKLDCTDFERNKMGDLVSFNSENLFENSMISGTSGNLMGLAMTAQTLAIGSRPPVSINYYARKQVEKIPVIRNTAYARTTALDHRHFLWSTTYNIWEASKNLAYGMLALFMLYTGIMIMARKKIDPRTAVTVQNALPRIVIALVLITFSYVIGALAADAIIPLSKSAASIIPFNKITGFDWAAFGAMLALNIGLTILIAATTGVGVILIIFKALILILVLFLIIKMSIRIVSAYVSIAIQIIISPLVIAWGSIPGNEEAAKNVAKRILIELLAAPILTFGIFLAFYLNIKMLASYVDPSAYSGVWGNTQRFIDIAFSNLVVPTFMIMVLWYFSKLPKQLEKSLLDIRK